MQNGASSLREDRGNFDLTGEGMARLENDYDGNRRLGGNEYDSSAGTGGDSMTEYLS